MRIVVVGAGVIGLLTAVECARGGAQVELIEQSAIPSPTAASYDRHRVVRTLHRGHTAQTLAAVGLDEAWLEVERRLGARFYHRTGVLTVAEPVDVEAEFELLHGAGVLAQALTARELRARFPQLRLAAEQAAVLEPAAGTVLADQALLAAARWLAADSAVRCHPHRRVREVTEQATVRLDDGSVLAGDAVVVAAGPWSRELVPAALSARLTLKRQTMLSYVPVSYRTAWANSPAVLGLGTGHDAWLMPPVAGTPVRLSAASACRTVPGLTDRQTPADWREHLIRRFTGLLVNFDPTAVTATAEGYYLTDESDQGPLLSQLGESPVWTYAACGGMSFKFAPSVARALADRALGRTPRPTGLHSIDLPRQFAADGTDPGPLGGDLTRRFAADSTRIPALIEAELPEPDARVLARPVEGVR